MSADAYDSAFFEGQAARSLSSARLVLGHVFPWLNPKRVLDVGCGVGTWLQAAQELGADDVLGVDGGYVDPAALLIDRDRFVSADLAAKGLPEMLGARAKKPFDLVICMEVAEHLPHDRALSFVAELARFGDVMLFSAAVPFQYGTSHLNEQWPEYWSILFRGEGFECFDPLRAELWDDPGVDWWYAQNALLYARRGSEAAARLPATSRPEGRGLSRVHPDNLLANLLGLPRRYRQYAAQEEMQDRHGLVEANRRGDAVLPALAAPARAEAAGPEARDVFPWTRMEVWQPEQQIADLSREAAEARSKTPDLSRQLAETGKWLAAAERAFAAEREARFAAVHDATRWREHAQVHGAGRVDAEMKLVEAVEGEKERRTSLEAEQAGKLAALEAERVRWDADLRASAAALEARRLDLDDRDAALDGRAAMLNAQEARIDAVRRSPVWRVARGARRVGTRIAGRTQPPVPAAEPETPAVIAVEDLLPQVPPAEVPPNTGTPETPAIEMVPIRRYGELIGVVGDWAVKVAVTRLKRLDVFDAEDYLRRNPDVAAAGVDPYAHFVQSGALEGRGRTDPEDLARVMSGLALFDHAVRATPRDEPDDSDLARLVEDVSHVGLFVSSHGNVFMEDLAEDLAVDLRTAGVRVEVLDETSNIDTRPPTCLFIAPHEFFILGRGIEWVRDDVLCQSFMFGTEQVQTNWFNLSLPFILMARGVVDICAQTASLFERLDMAALHTLPGARHRPHPLTERDKRHPLYGVLPPAVRQDIDPSQPFAARPIDISFFGTSSPRRDAFFARNASFFADHDCFNYCRRPGRGPIRGEGEDGALTRLAGHVAGHSKITLNIHREEFGYFEWHRMVRLGMCAGSLVVSDPCLPHPDFVANEHYLQANARQIPNLLEWLLTTEDGAREAERVRSNVDALISRSFGTAHTAARLLRFFAQHRSRERG